MNRDYGIMPWFGGLFTIILMLTGIGCQKPSTETSPETSAWAAAEAYSGKMGVSGTIVLDSRLAKKTDKTDVLYIIAYDADRPRGLGPPLAAKRISNPRFPMAYHIGPEDVISEGGSFSKRIMVSARVDKDGDAGPIQPGDMTGAYKKNPAKDGEGAVDVVIDTVN